MKTQAVIAAALLLLAPLFALGADEGLQFSTRVTTKVSLNSDLGFTSAPSIGSATSLGLRLEGARGNASLRAGASLSLLQGNEASDLWMAKTMPSALGDFLLMSPAFDPAAVAPSVILTLALEELTISGYAGPFAFESGLSHANWGLGRAFSPADYFTDIDYSSGQPSRRALLLAKALWYPGPTSSLELVFSPYSKLGQALALRAYTSLGDAATLAVSAGIQRAEGSSTELALGGAELSLDLPLVSVYAESAFVFDPYRNWDFSYSIMGGGETRIADIVISAEYLFAPNETAKSSTYATVAWTIDEWFSLAMPLVFRPSPEFLRLGLSLSASSLGSMDYAANLFFQKTAASGWSTGLSIQAGLAF